MKFTKILSLMLCFFLISSPALAQSESEQMKDVLTTAKTILSIPEEYTDFTYYSQTDTDGTVYWSFSWSGEKKGTIDATLSEDGFLQSYYAWIYTESYNDSLANYTHEEAKEIAETFIKTVNPELYPSLREVTVDGENRNSRTAYFMFREFEDTIPVFANTVSVTVDKYHGIVRNYQGAKRSKDFIKSTPAITEDAAKAEYLRNIGIQMEYRLYYDYQKKEHSVFPVYYLKDTTGKAIDAITGEAIEPYFPESYLYRTGNNESMSDTALKQEAAGGVQFTPEELDALSNVSEVYSQEAAMEIAIKKIPALKDNTLHSASLQRDYQNETKLYWNFSFKNEESFYSNVQMDAKTGQLMSFSLPQKTTQNQDFMEEDAKQIAENFLKSEAADVFAKTEYTNEVTHYTPLTKENTLPSCYYLTYRRMENGIPVNGNYLTVRVDANTKQIGSYSRSFTDGFSFPDISDCMSQEEILKIMDEKMDFTLTYLPTKEGHILAYTFQNANSTLFDPHSGKQLNHNGTPTTETFLPTYTDISGHWAEEMILTLLDNGYYLSENEFAPDKPITKKEFLKLFQMVGTDNDEQIAELIAKIEEIEATDAKADAILTKQMLSRYFVYRMGCQQIAALDHIFLYPFSDTVQADESLRGDIALIAGMGIFQGDPDGNFYPQKELTRAEAACTIYHYLKISK